MPYMIAKTIVDNSTCCETVHQCARLKMNLDLTILTRLLTELAVVRLASFQWPSNSSDVNEYVCLAFSSSGNMS